MEIKLKSDMYDNYEDLSDRIKNRTLLATFDPFHITDELLKAGEVVAYVTGIAEVGEDLEWTLETLKTNRGGALETFYTFPDCNFMIKLVMDEHGDVEHLWVKRDPEIQSETILELENTWTPKKENEMELRTPLTTEFVLKATSESDVLEKFKECDALNYGSMANVIWDLKDRLERAMKYIANINNDKIYRKIEKMETLLESIRNYVDYRIKDFKE